MFSLNSRFCAVNVFFFSSFKNCLKDTEVFLVLHGLIKAFAFLYVCIMLIIGSYLESCEGLFLSVCSLFLLSSININNSFIARFVQ